MKKNIVVPKAGLTMTEASIAAWTISEGDFVKKDQVVADIMTEKMTVEVVAPEDGKIESILKQEGEIVQVGDTLATLVTSLSQQNKYDRRNVDDFVTEETDESALETYDVVVVGGGIGGYTAAIRVAQLGGKVALIEQEKLGGVCLNSGCIPTKTLLEGVALSKIHKRAKDYGIFYEPPNINFAKLIEKKNSVIEQLQRGVSYLLKKNKIKVLKGVGKLLSPRQIQVEKENEENEVINCKNIILATGSNAVVPRIPGLDQKEILTSKEALSKTDLPKSVAIIGAGAIGCEFAGIYAPLDVDVTLIESQNKILPGIDRDVSKFLYNSLKKDGVNILTLANVKEVKIEGEMKNLYVKKGQDYEEVVVHDILVAVGRIPNIQNLNSIGIKIEDGKVWVDEYLRTSQSNIFAVGDLTGIDNLAHVASAQAVLAAENCMGQTNKMSYEFIPRCIYTSPEIASVGLTEEEVKEKGLSYHVGKFNFNANGRALSSGETEGIIKVIREEKYNKILGIHIVGKNASELISEATLALNLEATTDEIGMTIHPHPTLSEGLLEAALDSMKKAIHI